MTRTRPASCFECKAAMEQTGRNTWYCPDCDTCPDCGCPNADGFAHYAGCPTGDDEAALADAVYTAISEDLDAAILAGRAARKLPSIPRGI